MPFRKFPVFLLSVWALFFAVAGFAFDEKPSMNSQQQLVLVFNRSNMAEMLSSSAIRAPGLPLIFSDQIRLACMAVKAWKGDILVYMPETSTCVSFSTLASSPQRNFKIQSGLDGRVINSQIMLEKLQEETYLVSRVTAPAKSFTLLQSNDSNAGVCNCPGNVAPVVNLVSGGGQQVVSGSPIGNIIFSATDVDSDVLIDLFSYQLNGGTVIDDLPAGLSKSCTQGTGTLNCTVSGTAPSSVGLYNIILEVSDGFNITPQSAELTVNRIDPPLPETIFENSFEDSL